MTFRLLSFGIQHWRDLNGYAVGQGVVLRDLELADFSDYVWWWVLRDADQQGRDKFEQWLWMPPKGEVATAGPWSAESESKSFQSFKAQMNK